MLETGNPDSIESTNVLFSPHARRGQKKGEIHEVKKSKCSFNVNVYGCALGVAPVGVSAANYGMVTDNNLHPWTDEAFADLGVEKPVVFDDVDGLDFEQISDCNPDVILAAYSGMTQEDYDTLSQIAPVIPYKEKAWQTSWREQTIENAEGMGMKPEVVPC